ncbi:DUF1028 domain-containing protein [Metallosphaera sedula]|uniref:DUF1028 domain-containing protein n=1 Tax=Metallosphaera sedula TaxID=43687 RepID=UPI0020C05E63|nr:DUF1028 domain-containing protein [Metallosphaera sedula]BBL46968.1 hypothetical protein MJ1HA_1069 [Metallosphaera sedula]
MTFSIVLYDPNLEAWGIGVASKYLAVGSVVPWAKPGVGAIATQAFANTRYGPEGLSLLERYDAKEVVRRLTEADPKREVRQLGVVDSRGGSYAFTGRQCHEYAGHIVGTHFTVQGNILTGEDVLEAMARVAESRGPIHRRLLEALKAGEAKGGDRRGKQSAAILVVKNSDEETGPMAVGRYVDLRVDDDPEPLRKLEELVNMWESTFMRDELVSVSDHIKEIEEALKRLGYRDLRTWVEENNYESNFTGDKIGVNVLKDLLRRSGLR